MFCASKTLEYYAVKIYKKEKEMKTKPKHMR